jgi:putative PIN family toxin of toxin-antitoxin system
MKNKLFVFDTNSLISAALIPPSVNRLALKKADENGHLVFSKETLTELNEVLIRSKFDKYISLSERLEYMERLESKGKIIKTSSNFTECRDAKDNKFLNLAYDSKAFCIITGDNDLLVLNPFQNIPIVSPSHFLNDFIIA